MKETLQRLVLIALSPVGWILVGVLFDSACR